MHRQDPTGAYGVVASRSSPGYSRADSGGARYLTLDCFVRCTVPIGRQSISMKDYHHQATYYSATQIDRFSLLAKSFALSAWLGSREYNGQ